MQQTHVRVEGSDYDKKQTLPRCCFQDTHLKLRHRKGKRSKDGKQRPITVNVLNYCDSHREVRVEESTN